MAPRTRGPAPHPRRDAGAARSRGDRPGSASTNPTWSATRATLALGYFDHPPLHVWMAWAAVRLFGSEAPIVVRLPFILLFAGSTWLMYDLTARLFGERAGVWAAALDLAPMFTLAPMRAGCCRTGRRSSSCSRPPMSSAGYCSRIRRSGGPCCTG